MHINLRGLELPTKYSVKSLRPDDAYMSVNSAIIGSDNGLLPARRQSIIWTNIGLVSVEPLRKNSQILIQIQLFSYKKMHLNLVCKMAAKFVLALMS